MIKRFFGAVGRFLAAVRSVVLNVITFGLVMAIVLLVSRNQYLIALRLYRLRAKC